METCKSIPDTSPLSAQDWEREAKRDPGLPRTFRDLARMANGLFTDVHPAVAAQGSPGVADFVAGLSDEHDALAKQRLAGYDLNRVLVQFGVQAPLGTWYKTASGTPAIPLFRDAQQSAHPELSYPQRIELDPQFAYTFTQPQCVRLPAAKVSRSGLFFFKATSRAGRSDFKIVGTAQAGQKKNPYLGAAVFTASTGDSAPGHSPIPLDASLTDVSIACNGDKEGAYYVVAGSPVDGEYGRTRFTVTVDGGAIPCSDA